jgi:hypothetical protein
MDGLALPWSDIPLELIRRHALKVLAHGHGRGGARELWFLRGSLSPLLPIWHEGQFKARSPRSKGRSSSSNRSIAIGAQNRAIIPAESKRFWEIFW